MGSSGNPDWMEEEDVPDTDSLSPVRPTIGLEASELDLLRSAPDYDAEEMSNVRPPGGWPTVAEPPAAACKPAAPAISAPPVSATAPVSAPPNRTESPAWSPPNRVEPPAWAPPNRVEPPAGPAPSQYSTLGAGREAASEARHRFPEERTVALMAEDLLGRPLDEPTPEPPSVPRSAAAAAPAPRGASGGADLWDQVMPLVSEG
jgi:hypothetical protein